MDRLLSWLSKNQIFIGWVLGVISAPIGVWFYSFLERRRFISALTVELNELRFRLAATLFSLAGPLGKRDRLFLTWVKLELEAYRKTPQQKRLVEWTQKLLNFTDDELAAANIVEKQQAAKNGKSIPDILIPYLNAQTSMIGMLSRRRQEALVNLLHQVEVINSKKREMVDWDRFTFEPTTVQNYDNATQNSIICLEAIYTAGQQASGWIAKFTDSKKWW